MQWLSLPRAAAAQEMSAAKKSTSFTIGTTSRFSIELLDSVFLSFSRNSLCFILMAIIHFLLALFSIQY